jgi:hypothetical protein
MDANDNIPDAVKRFDFLLGNWDLEYIIPKSFLSEGGTDSGHGSFSRALNNSYVVFEYSTKSGGEAKGIFAWDKKSESYKYWWFENSGNFLSATCNFLSDDVLVMNWHDSLLVQTFVKESPDKIVLKMQYPSVEKGYQPVLEVIFTRSAMQS